jgi:hypothetical protein
MDGYMLFLVLLSYFFLENWSFALNFLLLNLSVRRQLDKIHFDYLVEYDIIEMVEQQNNVGRMTGSITSRLLS